VRLVAAALLVALAVAIPASAAPSANQVKNAGQHLNQARSKLESITQHFSLLVEQYDQAQSKLVETQTKLDDAQASMDKAKSKESDARTQMDTQVSTAYESGLSSHLDVLLNASSMSDFSDRIQFLDVLSRQQARRANAADVAGQQAKDASQVLKSAKAEQASAVSTLNERKAAVEQAAQDQKKEISHLQTQYRNAVAAQHRAEKRARQAAAAAASSGGVVSGSFNPSSSGAAGAVQAAESRIGSAYVWGAAGPTSFDCSGLTMWAWAQVGVGLPHSSAEQYATLPHVSTSALQPGDLLFFYSPISHVGMYIGNGRMVAADNPGTGVHIDSLGGYWDSVMVGAARPG
jgi:cell wall-associated NlpC family hydrolase